MSSMYLAGPISGLSFGECTDWRKYACDALDAVGIKAWSPMRHKDYLANLGPLPAVLPANMKKAMSRPKGIISRDRFDCTRVDAILMNLLGAKIVSIGTMMELAWADLSRIPIICAIEESGNVHEHSMVDEAINFRVTSLEEAIQVAKAILL